MNATKRIVIIGATSAMAEHCARLWVHQTPVDLTLIGRDSQRVERVANDLRVRSPQSTIRVITVDFLNAKAIGATVRDVFELGSVDIVLIAHGALPDQSECQNDLQACRDALEINAISPVLYAEAFAQHMANKNHGTIALISSVAGDRGRKSNYVYGAAKGLVTRYAQGLQHRFANSGVKIVLIKPGPTDTPMTATIRSQGLKLARVQDVAVDIVKAIDTRKQMIYTPRKWSIIMQIIRHMPASIFIRINI